jgi:heme oxygenase
MAFFSSMKSSGFLLIILLQASRKARVFGFSTFLSRQGHWAYGTRIHSSRAASSQNVQGTAEGAKSSAGFIETNLRNAAMKLHTKEQAPREGQALSKRQANYIPTLEDYLQFLVDSKHVYEAFENAVQINPELASLQNTGLERVLPLEADINFIVDEYNIPRPTVGKHGKEYALLINELIPDANGSVPEFICHFYNFYFAHLAGGRMFGKKMSSLLLNNRTLQYYKVSTLLRSCES